MKKYGFVLIAVLLIVTVPLSVSTVSAAATDTFAPVENVVYDSNQKKEFPIVINEDFVMVSVIGAIVAIVSITFGNETKLKYDRINGKINIKSHKNTPIYKKSKCKSKKGHKKKVDKKSDKNKGRNNDSDNDKDAVKVLALYCSTAVFIIIVFCYFILRLVSYVY